MMSLTFVLFTQMSDSEPDVPLVSVPGLTDLLFSNTSFKSWNINQENWSICYTQTRVGYKVTEILIENTVDSWTKED